MVAVEEDDGRGGRKRTTRTKDTERGIPQGAPISLLLSNLYMRRFVLGWKTLGLDRHAPVEEEYQEGMPYHQRGDQLPKVAD